MVYTYTPAYYSSFQDSITSICKNILPFSFKKRGLPASERKISKQQTENLKWQQDSYHQILNLKGLHSEGILPEEEVSAFKSRLLETLIASVGTEPEPPVVLRDKLLFLQDLLYAKCISEEEYHSSKRPLLQRLAVQGAEIEARDVIAGTAKKETTSDEEWSVIDLRDDQCSTNSGSKSKPGSSAIKHIKGAASVLGFGGSNQKHHKNRSDKSIFDHTADQGQFGGNPSILMPALESEKLGGENQGRDKAKKKGFMGFDGFKKWKKGQLEDNQASPLSVDERFDNDQTCMNKSNLVSSPLGEGPDTKQMKRKLHSDGSASDFFIDKVLGDNIKKELTRIQTELNTKNPHLQFSKDEIDTISTKLPVDKADLKKFFPKSWCDRHGEVVLDVVKREFKDHVSEMDNLRNTKPSKCATFGDDENSHPNRNPYYKEDDKLRNESFSNPFWNPNNITRSSLKH